MRSNFLWIVIALFLMASCREKKKTASYNKGDIELVADDSFKSVAEAIAEAYSINYPETKITVKTEKEDLGFLDLLHDRAKLIIMSRNLSKEEIKEYEKQVELKFQPAKFAADAVVFVVPKNSTLTELSYEDIRTGLRSGEKKFIFDGTNSSNLNFVAQNMGQQPKNLKFSIIPGNENLISQLNKYPDKIGVVGLNTISRPYGAEAEKLRAEIKILPVVYKGKALDPSPENLKSMAYPFTRILYFLTNEGNFNLANGIIRFACTHLGQMVVEKEGLQPYNIYKREVQMR